MKLTKIIIYVGLKKFKNKACYLSFNSLCPTNTAATTRNSGATFIMEALRKTAWIVVKDESRVLLPDM